MKKVYLIITMLMFFSYAQSQELYINMHNDICEEPIFFLDYMEIDKSMLFSFIEPKTKDIKIISSSDICKILFVTKIIVVLDGQIFEKSAEKKAKLSVIKQDDIESIVKIDRKKAIELYGKKGKKGALEIKTKSKQ